MDMVIITPARAMFPGRVVEVHVPTHGTGAELVEALKTDAMNPLIVGPTTQVLVLPIPSFTYARVNGMLNGLIDLVGGPNYVWVCWCGDHATYEYQNRTNLERELIAKHR